LPERRGFAGPAAYHVNVAQGERATLSTFMALTMIQALRHGGNDVSRENVMN